jgi:hypothetical protein
MDECVTKSNEFEFLGIISQLLLEQCPLESHNAGMLISERMCWILLNNRREVNHEKRKEEEDINVNQKHERLYYKNRKGAKVKLQTN